MTTLEIACGGVCLGVGCAGATLERELSTYTKRKFKNWQKQFSHKKCIHTESINSDRRFLSVFCNASTAANYSCKLSNDILARKQSIVFSFLAYFVVDTFSCQRTFFFEFRSIWSTGRAIFRTQIIEIYIDRRTKTMRSRGSDTFTFHLLHVFVVCNCASSRGLKLFQLRQHAQQRIQRLDFRHPSRREIECSLVLKVDLWLDCY